MHDQQTPDEQTPLESWKEIAAYLQKDQTTVRRWEKREGLPVHRHVHRSRASVYAYASELDQWRAKRKPVAAPEPERMALWGSPLSSFATATLLLLALITVGDTTSEAWQLRAQGVSSDTASRKVWADPEVDVSGSISPDGNFLSYTDWLTGNLMLRDLAAGADRQITFNGSPGDGDYEEYAESSTISKDGNQVAYSWWNGDQYEIRIADLSAEATGSPRTLFNNSEVDGITPTDWSPDGAWIAARIARKDRTVLLGLIFTGDGSLRVLKSIDWRGEPRPLFSPDGRYVAYDLSASEESAQRDIYTLAVDGSQEVAAVEHPAQDVLAGWSPDGSELLFLSERSSPGALMSIVVSDGKPQGKPRFVQPALAISRALGISSSGELFYALNTTPAKRAVQAAPIDPVTGRMLASPENPVADQVGVSSHPLWSPDGQRLAMIRGDVIAIQDQSTGEVAEIRPNMARFTIPTWAPDGRALAFQGRDRQGRQGIFRMDIESGAVAPVVMSQPGEAGYTIPMFSPDGTKLYYVTAHREASGPFRQVTVEHTLASGAEREFVYPDGVERIGSPSPDGKWLVATNQQSHSLMLFPVDGEDPRELPFPGGEGPRWSPTLWTRDSSAIIAREGKNDAFWIVPLDGSEASQLDWPLGIQGNGWVQMHPSGEQIIWATGGAGQSYEIWALENFLPAGE